MCGDFIPYLCAIFMPPCGVLCARGCNCDLLINILLTLCFWLPGTFHACYVIGKKDEPSSKQTVYVNQPTPMAHQMYGQQV